MGTETVITHPIRCRKPSWYCTPSGGSMLHARNGTVSPPVFCCLAVCSHNRIPTVDSCIGITHPTTSWDQTTDHLEPQGWPTLSYLITSMIMKLLAASFAASHAAMVLVCNLLLHPFASYVLCIKVHAECTYVYMYAYMPGTSSWSKPKHYAPNRISAGWYWSQTLSRSQIFTASFSTKQQANTHWCLARALFLY